MNISPEEKHGRLKPEWNSFFVDLLQQASIPTSESIFKTTAFLKLPHAITVNMKRTMIVSHKESS